MYRYRRERKKRERRKKEVKKERKKDRDRLIDRYIKIHRWRVWDHIVRSLSYLSHPRHLKRDECAGKRAAAQIDVETPDVPQCQSTSHAEILQKLSDHSDSLHGFETPILQNLPENSAQFRGPESIERG